MNRFFTSFVLFFSSAILGSPSLTLVRNDIIQNVPAVQNTVSFTYKNPKKKTGIIFPEVSLSPYQKYEGLFSLLEKDKDRHSHQNLLDPQTIMDLNLFFYRTEAKKSAIIEAVYRGFSLNGKIGLARLLISPETKIDVLQKRQALLKRLCEDEALRSQLSELFKKLESFETHLYSLWNADDILYSDHVKKAFYGGSFKKFQGARGAKKLEFNRRMNDFAPVRNLLITDLILTAANGISTSITQKKLEVSNFIPTSVKPLLWVFNKLKDRSRTEEERTSILRQRAEKAGLSTSRFEHERARQNIQKKLAEIDQSKLIKEVTPKIIFGVAGALIAAPIYFSTLDMYKTTAAHIRKRMSVFIALDELCRALNTITEQEPTFTQCVTKLSALHTFVSGEQPEQRTFMTHIHSKAMRSTSYFSANIGKVLHSLPLFLQLKDSFAPLFGALGELEAYVSMANLMIEKKDTKSSWCFAQYETSNRPHLMLNDFTHPLIPTEVAVPNSIELGGPLKEQGMVVTGPNASGKSISLRSIALCILFAQTVSVTPAGAMLLTPISRIITFLNSIDNIAESRSLFQAEQDRILYMIKTAETLPKDQFSFLIADELLSSTAPREGEAATYGICHGLAQNPSCVFIIATHFPRLTLLPERTNGFYANYHVSAFKGPDGSITHPFKLEKGRSHQVVAIDIARHLGFDKDILDTAENFLNLQGIKSGRKL